MVVAFSGVESTVCSSGGTTATITFARDPGDLPPVFIKFDRLASSTGGGHTTALAAAETSSVSGMCASLVMFFSPSVAHLLSLNIVPKMCIPLMYADLGVRLCAQAGAALFQRGATAELLSGFENRI